MYTPTTSSWLAEEVGGGFAGSGVGSSTRGSAGRLGPRGSCVTGDESSAGAAGDVSDVSKAVVVHAAKVRAMSGVTTRAVMKEESMRAAQQELHHDCPARSRVRRRHFCVVNREVRGAWSSRWTGGCEVPVTRWRYPTGGGRRGRRGARRRRRHSGGSTDARLCRSRGGPPRPCHGAPHPRAERVRGRHRGAPRTTSVTSANPLARRRRRAWLGAEVANARRTAQALHRVAA